MPVFVFAFFFFFLGQVGFYAGRFIVNVFDLIIFPAILLLVFIFGSKDKKMQGSEAEIDEDSPLAEKPIDSFEETLKIKEPQE